MVRALSRSIGDLVYRPILALFGRSLFLTLLVFGLTGVGLAWLLNGVDPCSIWSNDDSCPISASAGRASALLLTAMGMWLLFPVVAIAVISAYMDSVVALIEARHYPSAFSHARPLGWIRGLLLGLRSSVRLIVYNLIAFPLYLFLLITGVGTALLFVAINGLAFGQDLGEMVAARHLQADSRRRWLRATRVDRALLGAVVAAIFLVPFLNLLAPILGAAMMTHFFQATPDKIASD